MSTTPYARKATCAKAMGIDWMTRKEMTQAVPPLYTKFIGEEIIKYMKGQKLITKRGDNNVEVKTAYKNPTK